MPQVVPPIHPHPQHTQFGGPEDPRRGCWTPQKTPPNHQGPIGASAPNQGQGSGGANGGPGGPLGPGGPSGPLGPGGPSGPGGPGGHHLSSLHCVLQVHFGLIFFRK